MADADQIITDLLRNIAVEQKFTNYDLQVTPISTGGANYTSHLFLATISEGERDLHVFAKAAAIGEKMRSQFPMKIYDIERFFYTKLANVFRRLEDKHNVPEEYRLKLPVFYGCNEKLYEETIVLENLTKKGYSSFDRFKTVQWEYAVAAVTELAKYHALSVAYHEDNPEEFEELLEKMKFDFPDDDGQGQAFWDGVIARAVEVTREENKERLQKFFKAKVNWRKDFLAFFSGAKMPVLGHGDYRPSNLMHKELEDGSVEVIPVDFQTIRSGSHIVDLFYFIFTGTNSSFRARHYQQLLDHYYAELRAALTRLGLDPDQKCSKEDFEAELKEKLPFGLAVAVFTLPIVTVEEENAPKVGEDMELSDFSITKTSSQFPERLNGVVDDFVRWGVI